MALPSNINPELADIHNAIYNIDDVTTQVKYVSDKQLLAIPKVEEIIKGELTIFIDWLKKDKIRSFLRSYKKNTRNALLAALPIELKDQMAPEQLDALTEKVTNKLTRKSAVILNNLSTGELTNQQLNWLKKAF